MFYIIRVCPPAARRMLRRSRGKLTKPSSTPAAQSQAAFARVAARTLAPSPIRDLLHRRLQPFRHLHDCSGCFRLERLAGWDLHPLESAAFSRRTQRAFALCACKWFSALLSAKRWRTRCGRRAAIRRAADFRKLRRPPARSSTTSQRRLRPSAMRKYRSFADCVAKGSKQPYPVAYLLRWVRQP